jgi:hypothetical protein
VGRDERNLENDKAHGLSKTYGVTKAVDELTFSVRPGMRRSRVWTGSATCTRSRSTPTVVDLPDMQCCRAILGFLHGNLLALAARRSWPSRPLDGADEACLTDGRRLDLVGKPTWSPTVGCVPGRNSRWTVTTSVSLCQPDLAG